MLCRLRKESPAWPFDQAGLPGWVASRRLFRCEFRVKGLAGFAIARDRRRDETVAVFGIVSLSHSATKAFVPMKSMWGDRAASERREPESENRTDIGLGGSVTTPSAIVRAASTACTTRKRCFSSFTSIVSGSSFWPEGRRGQATASSLPPCG